MHLEIAPLRGSDEVRALLRSDGWQLEQSQGGRLLAWHPEAPDGSSLRQRLLRLGLLTTAFLRIRLEPGEEMGHVSADRAHRFPPRVDQAARRQSGFEV